MNYVITIKESGGLPEATFEVTVAEGDSQTVHTVHLNEAYVKKLKWEVNDIESLVKKSFEFLLEREPKESILREFDLEVIAHYFPEYNKEIGKLMLT